MSISTYTCITHTRTRTHNMHTHKLLVGTAYALHSILHGVTVRFYQIGCDTAPQWPRTISPLFGPGIITAAHESHTRLCSV